MTIKDKAKRYDELLEKLRKAKVDNDVCDERFCCVIDDIIPELKDGEGEKIRNWLIGYFRQYKEDGVEKYANGLKVESIIDWLEKQGEQDMIRLDKAIKFLDEQLVNDKDEVTGEPFINFQNYGTFKETFISFFKRKMLEKQSEKPQGKLALEATKEEKVDNQNCVKPVDEVEPKFKVGNWYQCTKDFFGKGVTFDKNTAYYCAKEGCLQNEYGCHIAIVKDLYDNFKLWTIQDAKDGDVLTYYNGVGEIILLFKEWKNGYIGAAHTYAHVLNNNININNWCDCGKNAHPATKEQRDTLFSKMKEEGYVWLSVKKRLVKLLFKEGDTVRKKLDGSIWHINYINEHGYWDNHKPLFPIENQNEFELVEPEPTPSKVTKENDELTVSVNESHSILLDETINWDEIRIQAAIAAMKGMLANAALVDSYRDYGISIEKSAVGYANTLIEELRKKG